MRHHLPALTVALLLALLPAQASAKIKVVASFSIIGDLAREVAGPDADVVTLVGPDSDTHEYEPSPADAKTLTTADVVLSNGLNLEGWIDRLSESAGSKAALVKVSNGITPLPAHDEEEDDHGGHDHDAHDHGAFDPHAWQDVANARIYVANIAQALTAADPANTKAYAERAAAYTDKLNILDRWIKNEIGKLPEAKRKVITTHDAFGYFARAYGVTFYSQLGVSNEGQPSAAEMARLIDTIRAQKITALFMENMTDTRMIRQLEMDAGAHIGGTLYSDALSGKNGPAPDYISMMRHNVGMLTQGMNANP